MVEFRSIVERFSTIDRSNAAQWMRVSDGTRTRDHLDHNQELYQLSYAHQGSGA